MNRGSTPAWIYGEPVVERLHALFDVGYRPRLGDIGSASIDLKHPRAPAISLSCDGVVEDDRWPRPEGEGEIIWIPVEDRAGFEHFLRTTPRLNPWQSLKLMPVEDVVQSAWALIAGVVFLWAVGWVLEQAVRFARHLLFH